jgi:hypothetical protein
MKPTAGAIATGAGAPPEADAGRRAAPPHPAPPHAAPPHAAPPHAAPPHAAPPISRTEQRNAAVRATLTPLAPGERPWAIKIAVVLALLVGGGDLIDVIVGGTIKVGGTHAGAGGIILFSVLMLVCAAGMWQLRYWAVLGFQAILAIVILLFSLLLIRASNLLGFAVAIVIVFGGGWLFYKLVRVLSRLQLPNYPGR